MTEAIKAQEFVEKLVRDVAWLESTTLVLKQKEPAAEGDVNWYVTTGPLSDAPAKDLENEVAKRKGLRIQVDWDKVEPESDGRRTIAQWVSV
jgi:hypothetical protein